MDKRRHAAKPVHRPSYGPVHRIRPGNPVNRTLPHNAAVQRCIRQCGGRFDDVRRSDPGIMEATSATACRKGTRTRNRSGNAEEPIFVFGTLGTHCGRTYCSFLEKWNNKGRTPDTGRRREHASGTIAWTARASNAPAHRRLDRTAAGREDTQTPATAARHVAETAVFQISKNGAVPPSRSRKPLEPRRFLTSQPVTWTR